MLQKSGEPVKNVNMEEISHYLQGENTSQVVQDFFHQRYHEEARYLKFGDLFEG